jgi:hypothetical protein
MGFLPIDSSVDFQDKDSFTFDTFHVGIAAHIVGLSRYGMMHDKVMQVSNINGWEDINHILTSFKLLNEDTEATGENSPSLWVSDYLKIERYDHALMFDEGILALDRWDEIELSDSIIDMAFEQDDGIDIQTFWQMKFLLDKFESEVRGGDDTTEDW